MDIAHARTFLAISELGSFIRAADRLNVTQSTVSARIKVLEDELGTPLFARSKAGVSLTPAGARFERHAQAVIRIWQQARQEVALPSDQRQILTIGAQFSLWDGVLLDWLCGFRRDHAEIAVRAEVGSNEELMRRLVDGLLDVAVIYTPQTRPGLIIEQLLEETLVLVGTQPHRSPESIDDYVYIDWGVEFRTSHAIEFPSGETSGLFAGLGVLALEFILRNGGTGYFPIRVVKPLIDEGRLHPVRGAPRFHRPAYLVYYPEEANAALRLSVELLRREGARADRVRTPDTNEDAKSN
jgi:DNA-binding transcriptional LysR family regulator